AAQPLVLPGLADGSPAETCPGFVVGVEFAAPGRAYATDFCDGTLTGISVAAAGAGEVPLAPARFALLQTLELVAPVGPASLGLPQAPGALRVRAVAGGPDEAAVLVGEPEGLACAVAVPAPAPAPAALGAAALLALTTLAAHRARRSRRRRSNGGSDA
ncbi:MAG TPA: hypothetical protein VLC53_14670, partial [Myxococcota bacterium]|nr:hypothetical protein [Myxococcota bacterium]